MSLGEHQFAAQVRFQRSLVPTLRWLSQRISATTTRIRQLPLMRIQTARKLFHAMPFFMLCSEHLSIPFIQSGGVLRWRLDVYLLLRNRELVKQSSRCGSVASGLMAQLGVQLTERACGSIRKQQHRVLGFRCATLSHRLTATLRLLGFSEILASSFGSRVELLPFVNNKIPELLTSFGHV